VSATVTRTRRRRLCHKNVEKCRHRTSRNSTLDYLSIVFFPCPANPEFNSESQSDTVGNPPLASDRCKLPAPTDIALPNKISSWEA